MRLAAHNLLVTHIYLYLSYPEKIWDFPDNNGNLCLNTGGVLLREKTHLSIVPNNHLGSLLNGILMPWNLATFSAISADTLGILSSSVSSFLLCK